MAQDFIAGFGAALDSGHTVSADLFGAMMLYHVDDLTGSGTYTGVIDNLGVSGAIRWSSGTLIEENWDLANPDAFQSGEVTFTQFANWAVQENRPISVIIPTSNMFATAYDFTADDPRAIDAQKLLDVENFLRNLLDPTDGTYDGVSVYAIEIGNEYWDKMASEEYGILAEAIIGIYADVIADLQADGTLPPGFVAPKLLVQTGSPFAAEFKEDGKHYDLGFHAIPGNNEETAQANNDIIDQLSTASRALVDGIVHHYFYNKTHIDGAGAYDGTFSGGLNPNAVEFRQIGKDVAIWNQATGFSDLELHITAWNVKSDNYDQLGLRGASVLLEQFENMIANGVDAAQLWQVQGAKFSALSGNEGDSDLSFLGVAFQWMTEYTTGATLLDSTIFGGDVEVNAYQTAGTVVFFISSRSEEVQNVQIDFSGAVANYADVTALQLGVLDGSSDGQYTISSGTFVVPDDNDPDAVAEIVTLGADVVNANGTDLVLNPYEVVMIEYQIGFNASNGDAGDNTLNGGDFDDYISGWNGNDTIFGGDRNDVLFGNNGSDNLIGGAGDDYVNGGAAGDILSGWAGDDVLDGKGGWDRLYGNAGDDTLNGGTGRDIMSGGSGNDMLTGGDGFDDFYFTGNDTGQDVITDLELGVDRIQLQQIAGVTSMADLTFTEIGGGIVRIAWGAASGDYIDIEGGFSAADIDNASLFVFS